MAPIHVFGPLVLFSLSIPLTIFAAVTTSLAIATLLFRVSIVYFELGLAVLQSCFSSTPQDVPGISSGKRPTGTGANPATRRQQPNPRHRRRSSNGVKVQVDITPNAPPKSESFSSLLGGSGPNRDFEGLGGWREGDEEEEAVWMRLNSRLELPTPSLQHPQSLGAAAPSIPAQSDRPRRHRRSLTSQSQRFAPSPEAFRMSPVESRNRTPPATSGILEGMRSPDGYFDVRPDLRMMSHEEVSSRLRMEERRASVGSAHSLSTRPSKTSLPALDAKES